MKIKYQFTDNKYGYIYTTIARNKYEARLNILRKNARIWLLCNSFACRDKRGVII